MIELRWMASTRFQLVTLLIATLIFSAVQCVASCADVSPKPAVPPCHQHKAPGHDLAASCAPDFVVPVGHPSPAAGGIAIGEPVVTLQSAPLFAATDTARLPDFSPPSSILRI